MKYIIILLSKFINKKIRKFWLKLITNFKKRRIYQEEKHKKKYENMNKNIYKLQFYKTLIL